MKQLKTKTKSSSCLDQHNKMFLPKKINLICTEEEEDSASTWISIYLFNQLIQYLIILTCKSEIQLPLTVYFGNINSLCLLLIIVLFELLH